MGLLTPSHKPAQSLGPSGTINPSLWSSWVVCRKGANCQTPFGSGRPGPPQGPASPCALPSPPTPAYSRSCILLLFFGSFFWALLYAKACCEGQKVGYEFRRELKVFKCWLLGVRDRTCGVCLLPVWFLGFETKPGGARSYSQSSVQGAVWWWGLDPGLQHVKCILTFQLYFQPLFPLLW